MGPLAGIKVLDLSRVLAGPWATQALADMGATVYKIERPKSGDDTRQWGPPWLKDANGNDTRESAYYLAANRGKQSLAIDIATPEGQDLVRQLTASCDVFVENFKVGDLARYGLAWSDLAPRNPRLVYCSISAFGQSGPLASAAGYDAMIQGMGGLMSVTGNPDGTPGGGPQKVGVAVADLMTGMYAVSAILGALYERTRSSLGQHIDLALLDTQVAWLCNQNMNYLLSGKPPVRQGSQHPNIVPYGSFATKDGHLMLAIGNDRQFASFMQHAGRPDVAADARYQTNTGRLQHREDVLAIVSMVLSTRTTREWLDTLTPAAVPCGPINNLAEVFAEPQVQHRHLLMQLTNSQGVSVPQVRNPIVYSRSELSYRRAPPALGEHSDSVLACELGLDAPALAALRARGVIE